MKKSVMAVLLSFTLVAGFVFCTASITEAAKKDTLTVALTTEIITLDCHKSAGISSEIARRQIYEGLTYADEKNKIHPLLAEKWEISPNQLEWTFHLKKNVKFQDGTPFNAQAVKINFDRLLNQNSKGTRRYLFENIIKVEPVDEYTVKLTTKKPQANMLHILAYNGGHFTSPKLIKESGGKLDKVACGTGPYKLKQITSGEMALLERNENYWGKKPGIKEIKLVAVSEEATRITMLEAGEADYILAVSPPEANRLENEGTFSVLRSQSNRVAHIGMNLSKKPFNDKRVREAINCAINREQIVKGVLEGGGIATAQDIAPATWGYQKVKTGSYSIEKAKKLLAEAGYPKGFSATLWTPQGRYFRDKETALAVAGQLRKVGIDLNVQVVEWGQLLKELRVSAQESKFDTYLLGWESSTGEIDYILDSLFTTKNMAPKGWNTMYYSNPEVDALIDKVSSETNAAKRPALLKTIQQKINDDAVWAPLYIFNQINVYRKGLKGVIVLPLDCVLFTSASF